MMGILGGRLFDDVKAFHEKFGLQPMADEWHKLPDDVQRFRLKFLLEELLEYAKSVGVELRILPWHYEGEFDAHEALDGLADLVYVALGTAYLHGFDKFNEAWARIHEANMKKVQVERVEDSKRCSKFDVVKPPGWEAPRFDDLL